VAEAGHGAVADATHAAVATHSAVPTYAATTTHTAVAAHPASPATAVPSASAASAPTSGIGADNRTGRDDCRCGQRDHDFTNHDVLSIWYEVIRTYRPS
jgi:hypothetical protein